MKILVVQDWLRSGGTERQAILLTREFALAGHASSLLTFRPGGRLSAGLAGVASRSLQPFDTHLDWFAPCLARTVRDTAPDVLLCMGKTANAYAGGLQATARKAGLATVVIGTLRSGYALPWYYVRSIRRVRHVVANSQDAARFFAGQYGFAPERMTVIHNSLVFPEVAPVRDENLRAQWGAKPTTTVLLSVAMFRPEKGQSELISTVAGLPASLNWQLWLAGDGPARPACERLAASLGLGNRIRFLGFHSNPAPLYAAADIAVHASREEALSNFLIEAQAHGLPAVACEALGIDECFLPGRTGWKVPHGAPEIFRSAVLRLASAPTNERTERAAEARSFARENFDPSRQVAAYLDLFRNLQATAPAP